MIINHKAKYSSNNIVERNFFFFGVKEVVNRYIFNRKHKLNFLNFISGLLFLILKNFIFIFLNNYKFINRIMGNILGSILILFKIKKIDKLVD